MTATEKTMVWNGPELLRQFLVAIADLEPFPGNPRIGDPKIVAGSLRRFGQLKPIVVDGPRIVAGHHVVKAAESLGWTHVAAMPNEFGSEAEQRAFLLADNRASDVGTYDLELLHAQLGALAQADTLEGTGYDDAYLADLKRDLDSLAMSAAPPPDFPLLDPLTLETEHRCPSCGYEWSGNPAPGAAPAEPAPE